MEAKNTVGTLIKVLAIITYCCGAFLFFVGAYNDVIGDGVIALIAGFLSGTMLLGFSEIIRLLHGIKQKIH
jgi:hypothetical protein